MQASNCPKCGRRFARRRNCPDCGWSLVPLWNVLDMRGRVIAVVGAHSESGALRRATETPALERHLALAVRPKATT